jgi:DHA2 family methylenomycin A resistance protein-like MFS transporter
VLTVAFVTVAAFYSVVFVQSLYFQQQRDLSPLATGLLFLPMTGAVTLTNARSSALARRFRRTRLVLTGTTVQAVGLGAIAMLPSDCGVGVVAAVMALVGTGGALTVPPIASLVVDAAPDGLVGTASGLLNTARQVGAAVGVAAVGAVISGSAVFMHGLRAGLLGIAVLLVLTAALQLRFAAAALRGPRVSAAPRCTAASSTPPGRRPRASA